MVHAVSAGVSLAAITFCAVLVALTSAAEVRRQAEQITRRLRRGTRLREELAPRGREAGCAMWVSAGAWRLAQINAMQVYSPELAGEHEVGVN